MSLQDDKQQNIQMELDFSSALTGEAREAGREETESSGVMNGTQNPASTNRLMEAVCERENLKAAMRLAAVENTAPSPGGTVGTGGARATGEQHCRQRSRPLVPREGQGPLRRAF